MRAAHTDPSVLPTTPALGVTGADSRVSLGRCWGSTYPRTLQTFARLPWGQPVAWPPSCLDARLGACCTLRRQCLSARAVHQAHCAFLLTQRCCTRRCVRADPTVPRVSDACWTANTPEQVRLKLSGPPTAPGHYWSTLRLAWMRQQGISGPRAAGVMGNNPPPPPQSAQSLS